MNIVVTGASGVVGRELIAWLSRPNKKQQPTHQVLAVLRHPDANLALQCQTLLIPDLSSRAACETIAAHAKDNGVLIHLAALTPGARHTADDFQRINALATGLLARAAVDAGVSRLVYMSSTHASAALTPGHPIDEASPPGPNADPYGASKLAGEAEVKRIMQGSRTQWTIVRAPLVYGPGVKGSLALLTRAIVRGVPLPLARVSGNARDMIGLRNLAAFLEMCATHERAANETFVVRDGDAVSTRGLTGEIAAAAGRNARLVPVPPALLTLAARALGARAMAARLTGDHQVNDTKARQLLGWTAPYPRTFDLQRMVTAAAQK